MPKRLAILYDCPFPFIQGGGQKRLFEIAQFHLRNDWEVEWYALKFWEGPDKIKHEGIIYNSVGKQIELYDSVGKRRLWETIYYGTMIARHIELRKFDILLAGQWPLFHLIPARIFCFLGKSKLVVDWWEVWGREHWQNYFGIKGVLGFLLEKYISRITPHIIAITQKGKRQLQELGVKQSEVIFIPNGIDFAKIMGSTAKSKNFDLVYMGRLQSHKNVSHILQGIALLKDRGCSITFQIIGDGPERTRLEELTSSLNIDKEVFFHGMIESDMEAYARMKASRLFVNPSTSVSGSISILEANACGLPVIAYKTDQGVSDELIEEGVNGYWVEEINSGAMAEKFYQLLLDKNLGQNIKDNSIEYARRYDWSNIAGEYNKYFLGIMADANEKKAL
ncbi:MAG: glycosyltransferase family 4 protein [Nitrospina sp.]|jgi:glycosyltransferase involved in cell wall biosynthesis|nr:glycosyltransferase family 4 protein [Nitrospina sp.]MBT5632594.1 glycosyltransferase family 4 protein [Nitrospina sp.]